MRLIFRVFDKAGLTQVPYPISVDFSIWIQIRGETHYRKSTPRYQQCLESLTLRIVGTGSSRQCGNKYTMNVV
jgi:hypothetical protein